MRRLPGLATSVLRQSLASRTRPHGRLIVRWCLAVLVVVLSGAASSASAATRNQPLVTAFMDPMTFGGPSTSSAFARVRAAGASVVRLMVPWQGIAPTARPPSFQPADPADPNYKWAAMDRQVKIANG